MFSMNLHISFDLPTHLGHIEIGLLDDNNAQVSVPVMSNSVSVKSFSFPYKGLPLELHIS